MKSIPIAHTAEAASLSLMSVEPKCLTNLTWDASLFAISAHCAIFSALAMVAQRTGKTGALAVIAELEGTGKLESCGGSRAVLDLLKTVYIAPGPIAVETADDYRKQLVRAKGFRDVLEAYEEQETEIRAMRADLPALAEVFAKAGEDRQTKQIGIREHLTELIADIERKTPLERFTTGLPHLDRILGGGMHRGEMTVVGAATSCGKSILLYQAALKAAQAGKKVAIFSLEMPAKSILRRMACNLVGKPVLDVPDYLKLIEEQRAKVANMNELSSAMSKLMNAPIIIRDDLSDVSEINAEARRLANAKQADLIIVDYLQIVTMPKTDNREQAVSELARLLKLTALNTQVAVMTASQLNDDGKLRESRAIGMHADNVLMIKHDESGSLIFVEKARNGERGTSVKVVMRGDISRFDEAAYDPK